MSSLNEIPERNYSWKSLKLATLPAPVIYAMAIFFDKAISFISVPLITAFLQPTEYGQLDIALSLIELCAIILALGLTDTLIRFASSTQSPSTRNLRAAELVGTALPITLLIGVLAQITLPYLMDLWKITLSETAVRISLIAATVSGFIDMPLTWIRMRDRPFIFAAFICTRVLTQLILVYVMLKLGYGAAGWLIASSLLTITLSIVTTGLLIREVGFRFSFSTLRRIVTYAVPLVGAGLAAYALANLSRGFLANSVPAGEIAQFTLASRLATAASLLLYPFILWWGPQRIAVLEQEGGQKRSADMWGVGACIIVISGTAVALTAPIFVSLALPASYAPAIAYIPFVVVVLGIGQLGWLCSTSAYARSSGLRVLAIEWAAAGMAVAAYFALVARWGIPGAIAAMLIGQCARLLLFALADKQLTGSTYPITATFLGTCVAIGFVALAPPHAAIFSRLMWTALALTVLAVTMGQSHFSYSPQAFLADFHSKILRRKPQA